MKSKIVLTICISVVVIICVIISLIFGSLLLVSNKVDKLTEEDIVSYKAIVTDVEITQSEHGKAVQIYIDRMFSFLLVSPMVAEQLEDKMFYDINKGTEIEFSFEKKKLPYIDNAIFIDIVQLQINDEFVFSVEDYNRFTKPAADNMRFAILPSIITADIFAIVGCIAIVIILKKKR